MIAAQPLTLLCLPCAGASATMYLRWRRRLPAWVTLVPVELPGRGARMGEDFVHDFERLVARLCDEHLPSMRVGRFALFGHSMGALLAYGMARRLRSIGEPLPALLAVSASAAPSRRDTQRYAGRQDDASLMADLREQGGTPQEVFDSPELLRLTLDTLAADYRVCGSFERGDAPPLPVPLCAFAGRHDGIDARSVDAWSRETSRAFTLDWFDGGHFFLRQHEAAFLATLVQRLARSTASIDE